MNEPGKIALNDAAIELLRSSIQDEIITNNDVVEIRVQDARAAARADNGSCFAHIGANLDNNEIRALFSLVPEALGNLDDLIQQQNIPVRTSGRLQELAIEAWSTAMATHITPRASENLKMFADASEEPYLTILERMLAKAISKSHGRDGGRS